MKKAAKLAKVAKLVAACLAGAVVVTLFAMAILGSSGALDKNDRLKISAATRSYYGYGSKVTGMFFVDDRLYYTDGICGVFRYNDDSGESEFIGQPKGINIAGVCSDGKNVVYGWEHTVYRFDLQTGESTPIATIEYPPAEVAALDDGWISRKWSLQSDNRSGGINVCFSVQYPTEEKNKFYRYEYIYYRLDTETGELTLADAPVYDTGSCDFETLSFALTGRRWKNLWGTYQDRTGGGVCFGTTNDTGEAVWLYSEYPYTVENTFEITELRGRHGYGDDMFLIDTENCRIAVYEYDTERFFIYDVPSLKGE